MARRGPTQKDVARLAGVSQAAVSRVQGGHGYVAEPVRARIMAAMAALDYRPDPLAQSLITGRSNIVAVVVGNMLNPFFPVLLDAMTESMRLLRREVLLFNLAPGQDIDDLIPDVLRYKVAGIIVAAATLSSRASEQCDAAGVPVVLFHRYTELGGTFAVACNNVGGGELVARLLLAAGRSRVAYIGGLMDSSPNRDRRAGFIQGLARQGVAPILVEDGEFSYAWGRRATLQLFRSGIAPDGIFGGDDAIACGVLDALRHDLKLQVPEDVSVVGFDDIPEAAWASYDLTTIRQPLGAMIQQALELLDHPEKYERRIFLIDGELVTRGTIRARS